MRGNMRIITVCLLVIFICLSGASQLKAVTQSPPSSTPKTQLEEPHAAYVLAPLEYVGQAHSTIISKLGTPEKQSVEQIKNTHNPAVTDYIHTVVYDGLKLTTYKVSNSGEEFLLSVEMHKSYPLVAHGLQIGMTEEDLKKRVGSPRSEKNGTVEWSLISEVGEYAIMTVSLENGKVVKILWAYPID